MINDMNNTITLCDGTVLECFPKEDRPEVIREDPVELDRTGEFLQVKGGPRKKSRKPSTEPWMELFFKEAFFLYEHREAILADSRMFLTPLPFRNNLAYTGMSGLNGATLGIYLEWWDQCERAVIKDDGEVFALTYFIAGSPLSGSNHCSAVRRNGKTMGIRFPGPFLDIWTSFMKINGRYTEAKQVYQAYSLEETVARLKSAVGVPSPSDARPDARN